MPESTAAPFRVLYSTAETHPTHRVDITALFGKYLPRLGVQSDLLALHHHQPPPAWPGGQRLTRPGPARGAKRHLLSVWNDLRMLWLARRGYQAVIVRDKSLGGLIGLVAARLAGIPFVYWMSFPMAEAWAVFARDRGLEAGLLRWLAARARAGALKQLLYRVVLARADHLFVQSDRMRDELVSRGLDSSRMTPVHMGVDTEVLSGAVPSEPRLDPPVFVYLGTLNRTRHPDVMIEAFAQLRASGVAARLLLIGDAEEESDRRSLRELVSARGLDDVVELTGWLPSADGMARCAAASAGLSPFPRTEILESASPTKVVEYFHLGLPVIANDQPDQAALLRAAGGDCVALTPEGFAAGMRDFLARPQHHLDVARAGQQLVRRTRSYEALAALVAARLRQVAARS